MKKTALGFTLIELLVSVSIGLILVLGGLAAYKGMGSKQIVKQEGTTFKTNLKSFQQKAMSGEKPVGCISLQNYTVAWVNPNSYSVQAVCLTNSGDETTLTLDEEVVFDADFGEIEFLTLKTWIDNAPFVIILGSESYEYEVNIEQSGLISGQML